MAGESFDIKKLLKSPFTGMYWVKSVMLGLGILAILMIVFTVYKAFFKKPQLSQVITAETGSNVTVIQKADRKRFFIPFIEGSVAQSSGGDNLESAIRGGLRFEF